MFCQLQLCYELVKYDHLLLQRKCGFQSPPIILVFLFTKKYYPAL